MATKERVRIDWLHSERYVIRLKATNDYWADWEMFAIVAWDADGKNPKLDINGGIGLEFTDDLDKAEVTASGYVKWDGCMEFGTEPDDRPHFCGIEDWQRFAQAVLSVFSAASDFLPAWDHQCAGTTPVLKGTVTLA